MWKYLVAFVLIMHGLAHIAGPLGFWTSGPQAFAEKPWLLSQGITPQSTVGRLFGLVWLVAVLGFVGAGLGLLFGQAWWPTLAVAAAVVSLVAIVPWVRLVPPGAWAGACLDLVILVALLPAWGSSVVEVLS
jgi:hypothetical protein